MTTCGCCEGVHVTTPRPVDNRPGLPRLAYRVGTHGSFLASMVARLSSTEHPSLAGLTARSPDDAAIAMLDGWAIVADVLTFYQERIANEGYLRTAGERRSILELGRLVDWALRPGVSATAFLSYKVDPDPQDPGTDRLVTIPAGSRVQSVPEPGQLPQTFETAEDLQARALWSRLEPRRRRPPWFAGGGSGALFALYLKGLVTDLKPGMRLVLDFGAGSGVAKTVAASEPDPEADITIVRLVGSRQAVVTSIEREIHAFLEGLDPPAKTGQGLLDRLGSLLEATATRSLADLNRAVTDAIDVATETALIYRERGFTNLAAWATTVLDDLGAILSRVVAARRAPLEETDLSEAPLIVEDDPDKPRPAIVDIGSVLGALRKPRSIPPPDGRSLARNADVLFGEESDLAPQLLTALDRRVAGTLYQALESVAGKPSGLNGVSALRIKCQPFGATAPLRAITDGRGMVSGFEDWPIDSEATLSLQGMRVDHTFEGLTLAVTTPQMTIEQLIPFGQETADLAPFGKATISGPDDGEVTVTFTVLQGSEDVPVATIDVRFPDAGSVEVTFSDIDKVTLAVDVGTQQSRNVGIRRYAAMADEESDDAAGSGERVTAITRQPLPPQPRDEIDLDAEYEGILPGSWIVIEYGDARQPFIGRVESSSTISRADYGIVAKVSHLTLSGDWLTLTDTDLTVIRGATVFVISQPLDLALEPFDDDICGATIELQRIYPGLESARWIIVEGERTDVPGTTGVKAAELAMIAGVTIGRDPERPSDTLHTTITLAQPLAYCYRRQTAIIHGNVARATHGETREEVLGSGDASKPRQSFPLRTKPLTYLADESPLGAAAALELRVDTLRWLEARDLVSLGPRDHRFILRTDDADATTVIFGNGSRGARPTTGQENVTARYRTGTGIGGNIAAGKLSQLMTRPLGVSEVVNPLASTGGADRESLEQGRRNLPLGVLALDRLVSVVDYEDFARARAGIGQASAVVLSDGSKRLVHLTIAGSQDAPIDPSSDLFRSLRLALQVAGDPSTPVEVAVRELMLLIVAINVRITDDRRWEDVEPKVRARLLERFGFDFRRLGQDVILSELQAAVQAVPGVVYSDVDTLAAVPESVTPEELTSLAATLGVPPPSRIPVRMARFEEARLKVMTGETTLAAIAARSGTALEALVRLNPELAGKPLLEDTEVVVRRGIRPAQIALLSPVLADTLILRNVPS